MTRSRRKHAIIPRGSDDEAVNYPKAARKRDRKSQRKLVRNNLSKFKGSLEHDSAALQARRQKIVFEAEPDTIPAKPPRKATSCRICAELHRHRCVNKVSLQIPHDAALAKKVENQYDKYEKTLNPAFLAQYRRYKYK